MILDFGFTLDLVVFCLLDFQKLIIFYIQSNPTLRDISHGIHLARGKNVGTTKTYLTVNISQGPISKRYVLVLESYPQQRSEDF